MDRKFAAAAGLLAAVILILLSAATVYKINEFSGGRGMQLFLLAVLLILLAYAMDNVKDKILNKFRKS